MKKFVRVPDISFEEGIKVNKKTTFTYENDKMKQELKKLKFHIEIKTRVESEIRPYDFYQETDIDLESGDILLYDKDRGYYLPPTPFCTAKSAEEDFANIQ